MSFSRIHVRYISWRRAGVWNLLYSIFLLSGNSWMKSMRSICRVKKVLWGRFRIVGYVQGEGVRGGWLFPFPHGVKCCFIRNRSSLGKWKDQSIFYPWVDELLQMTEIRFYVFSPFFFFFFDPVESWNKMDFVCI